MKKILISPIILSLVSSLALATDTGDAINSIGMLLLWAAITFGTYIFLYRNSPLLGGVLMMVEGVSLWLIYPNNNPYPWIVIGIIVIMWISRIINDNERFLSKQRARLFD